MSGTSLDGLDMAYCRFIKETEWSFGLLKAQSVPYDEQMRGRLRTAHLLHAAELMQLDHDLGVLHGELVKQFIKEHNLSPDYISSHGHTIVHDPKAGYTLQIGNPNDIAVITGVNVVADFRRMDVANGGQGAPLVPIGDEKLFHEFDACLNLGGIANISFRSAGQRVAFDISLCNILFNALAEREGLGFDEGGNMARKGSVLQDVWNVWNGLPFFKEHYPKSLGREFFESHFKHLVSSDSSTEDLLRTALEHVAYQIAQIIVSSGVKEVLVTGGGAKNTLLVERIQDQVDAKITVPNDDIVDFKEAIVFGFLGALKVANEANALASVTGAKADAVVGIIVQSPHI
jgi:anhydro-N-acetylmuramic acid kinase